MKRLFSIFLIFIVLLSGCAAQKKPGKGDEEKSPEEIRALWISIYDLSEFKGISEGGFRAKAENMFADIAGRGFNHIFLQVRPFSDAFYKSEIFPWSKYISGEEGKSPGYDPLAVFIKVAHSHNLKLHAWINPYRISATSSEMKHLADSNPAKSMYEKNTSDIYVSQQGIYYNPASLTVQKLILDGVRELVNNYDIDGIHIDDFFYPTTSEDIDKTEYEKYKQNSGNLTLDQFRLEQVNAFVSGMYSVAKAKDESIIVSISPGADIDKNMNELYADVRSWSQKEGFCDWLIPQIYYGFKNESKPFRETVKEWETLADERCVKLIIGLASYKCGEIDSYAGKGQNEWRENNDILSRQLKFLRAEKLSGYAIFSYGSLKFPNETMVKEWEFFSEELNCFS